MHPPVARQATAMTSRTVALLVVALLAGCASRTPRVAFGPLAEGLDVFLARHAPADGQPIRVDEVGRTASASYHLVQARGSESPHRHVAHELTVLVLRGRGILTLAGQPVDLAAGDAAVIPRGQVHWFAPSGRVPAVALVAFTPPLDAPDTVPADLR
jgi:quercetin dioxygenase-like cupin family protein